MGVVLLAAFAGFAPPNYNIPQYKQSDKVLHFLTFFLVTVRSPKLHPHLPPTKTHVSQTSFYWSFEISRRRVLQLTVLICTLGLGIGSEFVQWFLPVSNSPPSSLLGAVVANPGPQNERDFDHWDIVANILGSLSALALSTWYHKRMLERKRAARGYTGVPGDEDIELGEGGGAAQETGVIGTAVGSVEEELDRWDENAEDWETTEPGEGEGVGKAKRED